MTHQNHDAMIERGCCGDGYQGSLYDDGDAAYERSRDDEPLSNTVIVAYYSNGIRVVLETPGPGRWVERLSWWLGQQRDGGVLPEVQRIVVEAVR